MIKKIGLLLEAWMLVAVNYPVYIFAFLTDDAKAHEIHDKLISRIEELNREIDGPRRS